MAAIKVSVSDGVATLVLNRPHRRNAVTEPMLAELHRSLTRIAGDPTVRVVILAGEGADFSVGADLEAVSEEGGDRLGYLELSPWCHVSTLLHHMPQVTIAAVEGACAGAAMGWACACDLRIVSREAVFATAFLRVGASGDMGLAWFLSRIAGPARARELMFMPRKITAEQARMDGLVSDLVSPGKAMAAARACAQELCAADPSALRMMKANFVSAEEIGLSDYIEIETARHMHVVGTSALLEGARAFLADKDRKATNE